MYNYKSNTFTNICTEKNSYTSLKSKNSKIFFCFFEKKHKNSADILTAIWQMRSSKFGLENVQCNYYNRDRFHYKRIQTQKPDADDDF